ncbi:MAG TPA: hypothetical protein VME40_17480 [Caulobacteraceae bacterium]|nr:hypothetical protein [Caulobacteraceae bacterium]
MAAPVRPPVWPPAPSDVRPGRNDTRLAAQKAFFDAALAGTPAPRNPAAAAQAQPVESPRAGPAQAIRAATQVETATAADKLPRPGSIVDIYV